jgi:PKD repeat protein
MGKSKYWYLFYLILGLQLMVACSKQPEASFTINWTGSAHAPSKVYFYNSSVNADEFSWDFGDGTTSSEKSPTYIFVHGGTYLVRLVATNGRKTDEYAQTVTILNPKYAFAILNESSRELENMVATCYDDSGDGEFINIGNLLSGALSDVKYTNYPYMYVNFYANNMNYTVGIAQLIENETSVWTITDSVFQ